MIMILLLVLSGATARVRPDPVLTPGVIKAMTTAEVCRTKWGLDRRAVTEKMKADVAKAYGVPWEGQTHGKLSARARRLRALVEIDHFIPRELGGDDATANLWPEYWAGPYGAHAKDLTENELHRRVCRGEMTLEFAQGAIRSDWLAAYRLYVKQK